MSLKRVELESLLKGFLLFLISLTVLSGIIFYGYYAKEQEDHKSHLLSQMRLCSYNLQCKKFDFDFVPKNTQELHTLVTTPTELYALFEIPQSDQFLMKLSYAMPKYRVDVHAIFTVLMKEFFFILIALIVISALFSWYTLKPLRNALMLTEEFIKDILHDFNTPLSTLRLNARMLKREVGENAKLERIEQSVETVLNLQGNLRAYLEESSLQKESFDLAPLLKERIDFAASSYPQIRFISTVDGLEVDANRDALVRVIDNLLSNAAKYNRPKGRVEVRLDAGHSLLSISNTGRGIKTPEKVFDRFYKEHERGIGIGLHIVKKLCDAMGIKVAVESKIDDHTTFSLSLNALTHR